MFRPHNAYSGSSKWIKCTLPWSFLYISSDIRISQPLNDQTLSMVVHSYQYHVKVHLDLFSTRLKSRIATLLENELVTAQLQNDIPENDTRYGGLTTDCLRTGEHWPSTNCNRQRPNSLCMMMWLAQHGQRHAYCAAQFRRLRTICVSRRIQNRHVRYNAGARDETGVRTDELGTRLQTGPLENLCSIQSRIRHFSFPQRLVRHSLHSGYQRVLSARKNWPVAPAAESHHLTPRL